MTFIHFEFTFHFPVSELVDGKWPTSLRQELVLHLSKYCRDGILQHELGELTGSHHIQGHGILKEKVATAARVASYNANTKWSSMHILPSVTAVVNDFKHNRITLEQMYAAKAETRVDGPWKIEALFDEYIPRQLRELELYPWQESIKELCKVWDTRSIHIIYDPNGCTGKSTLCHALKLLCGVKVIQCSVVKDGERLEADFCSKIIKTGWHDPNGVVVDFPRAMPKENMHGIFSALENIKSGYVNDTRNEAKEWYFDCPNMFVFTNKIPDLNLLSHDRWKVWLINEAKELVRAEPPYALLNPVEPKKSKGTKRRIVDIDEEVDSDF